ncbi:hypothetical protein CLOM_g8734 [Closterium sp. NIES-68]|nr:hypothetical protein CLOM_g8734 [Closterium sp. NIES-68]GJP71639.1 hypothetical protein CLOP_g2454 [Closterium sp. NIES-67]
MAWGMEDLAAQARDAAGDCHYEGMDPTWMEGAQTRIRSAALHVVEAQQASSEHSRMALAMENCLGHQNVTSGVGFYKKTRTSSFSALDSEASPASFFRHMRSSSAGASVSGRELDAADPSGKVDSAVLSRKLVIGVPLKQLGSGVPSRFEESNLTKAHFSHVRQRPTVRWGKVLGRIKSLSSFTF